MEQSPESSEKQLRREVLQELAVFLRQHNKEKRQPFLPFLDRPFVQALLVTFIGGLIVTLITLMWQSREKQNSLDLQYQRSQDSLNLQYQRSLNDKKLELLRTLTTVYPTSGNVLNTQLALLLWLTEERNKPKSTRDENQISATQLEISKLTEQFRKVETMEGLSIQIETLFASPAVQSGASKIRTKWVEFDKLCNDTNAAYNKSENLKKPDIDRYEDSRNHIMEELNDLVNGLTRDMGTELRDMSLPAKR